jgi:RNA polymerase sigma-70 factor (ECF subfamily)
LFAVSGIQGIARMQESRPLGQDYEEFLNRFTRDRERIFAFVCSLVPRLADAEDIFQKCSLVLWRKFGEFQKHESFLAWACGVARYEVCNFLRTMGRDRLCFDDELIQQLAIQRIESLSEYDDRLSALRNCMKGLTEEQRGLLDAAYGHGNTVKQLAKATGSAVQTLYNRLGKLRRQLLDCIENRLAAQE